jgi:hypothetical protein
MSVQCAHEVCASAKLQSGSLILDSAASQVVDLSARQICSRDGLSVYVCMYQEPGNDKHAFHDELGSLHDVNQSHKCLGVIDTAFHFTWCHLAIIDLDRMIISCIH